MLVREQEAGGYTICHCYLSDNLEKKKIELFGLVKRKETVNLEEKNVNTQQFFLCWFLFVLVYMLDEHEGRKMKNI